MHWRFLLGPKWLFLPDPEWRFSFDANKYKKLKHNFAERGQYKYDKGKKGY